MQDEPSPGRLRWQCRRGMRELDVLLERWLASRYPGADATHRRAFERLLSATDPQLVAWLYRRERPDDPDVEAVVDELLAGER